MMVVVEGRQPRCWSCKQLGHIAKFCLQKEQPATTTVTVAATQKEAPKKSQDQAKSDEGWKEVARKKGKKGNFPKATVPPSPSKEKTPSQKKSLEPEPTPAEPVPGEGRVERVHQKRSSPTLLGGHFHISHLPQNNNNNPPLNNKQASLMPHLFPYLPFPPSPLQNSFSSKKESVSI